MHIDGANSFGIKTLWDLLHEEGKVNHAPDKPTKFAEEVQNIAPPQSKILELGCGVGSDSFYFAQNGHQVLATDFSKVAIENNKKRFKENNLKAPDAEFFLCW